jgi:hypothetical protein
MSAVSIGHAFDARSRRRARLVDACQHLPASAITLAQRLPYYPGKKSTMFCLRMRSAIGAGLR